MQLKGWVEHNGIRISPENLEQYLKEDPIFLTRCGGEFYVEWEGCRARDHFGIMPGNIPPGTFTCEERPALAVDPSPPSMGLDEAITTAVALRACEGVVALSGGVDSALVAALARLPAIVVGEEGSHDLRRATQVAAQLNLTLDQVVISQRQVDEALPQVLLTIPRWSVTEVAIATTLYFVALWAGEHGYPRILAGQGADELFGGYARYERSTDLNADLLQDMEGLPLQLARDQTVAAKHGTYFSLPYLDVRVVRAALAIPAREKVSQGVRKKPLREVASRILPQEIAYYEKKAMQYGSGVHRIIRTLARNNGYKNRVQEYIHHRRESQG
jgi:asparagine synthase (glutamine-hydrolysing)